MGQREKSGWASPGSPQGDSAADGGPEGLSEGARMAEPFLQLPPPSVTRGGAILGRACPLMMALCR